MTKAQGPMTKEFLIPNELVVGARCHCPTRSSSLHLGLWSLVIEPFAFITGHWALVIGLFP